MRGSRGCSRGACFASSTRLPVQACLQALLRNMFRRCFGSNRDNPGELHYRNQGCESSYHGPRGEVRYCVYPMLWLCVSHKHPESSAECGMTSHLVTVSSWWACFSPATGLKMRLAPRRKNEVAVRPSCNTDPGVRCVCKALRLSKWQSVSALPRESRGTTR